jgi:hypothetical protein
MSIKESLCCYKRCHGNDVNGFWALRLLSACWLFGDFFMLMDFWAYEIIFMMCESKLFPL